MDLNSYRLMSLLLTKVYIIINFNIYILNDTIKLLTDIGYIDKMQQTIKNLKVGLKCMQ
jgi:hypothetical protein